MIRIILDGKLSLPLAKAVRKSSGKLRFDAAVDDDVLPFIRDRLRVYLRDQKMRHDIVAAVLADAGGDDVCRMADESKIAGWIFRKMARALV